MKLHELGRAALVGHQKPRHRRLDVLFRDNPVSISRPVSHANMLTPATRASVPESRRGAFRSTPELDPSAVGYKMARVLERLRAFLREIGPGGVRGGLTILLVALALLVLASAAIGYGLVAIGREEAERDAGGEQYTISAGPHPEDFPLIFGPGSSPDLAQSTSADGRPRGIPGLSEMEVIGYLQHVPGTDFRCPGGGPNKRVCTLFATDGPAVYEVSFLKDGAAVLAVVATASDASEDEAARVLGYAARLSLEDASPIDAEAWVGRTISSGGQYFADGAEVRLYGTEQTRTLEIVATAPPDRISELTDLVPEVPDLRSPEITEQTTGRIPK
jgi:hypothetical protein